MNVPSVVRHSGTGPTPLELVSGRVWDLRTTGLNVAGAGDSVPLCVRRVYQSKGVPVYLLLYRMDLLGTVYRDHRSTIPRLRPPGIDRGVIARGSIRILGSSLIQTARHEQ